MQKSELLNLLNESVKVRTTFTSFLLGWDGKKISKTTKRTEHIKYYFGMVHTFLYASYLLYRLGFSFSLTKSGKTSLTEYVDFLWVLLWTIYYCWGVIMYINYVEKTTELCTFLNGLAEMSTCAITSEGEQDVAIVEPPTRTRNILRIIMFTMNFMVVSFSLCSGFMAVMLANKPEFISSLFASHQPSWFFLACLYVFEVYSVGVTVGGISFQSVYQSFYMVLSCDCMQHLLENNYITTTEKLKSFRILQIFNIYFNSAFTSLSFLTSLFAFFVGTIGTFFGAIRFHFISSFFEYMLFPFANICLIFVFTVLMYGSASVYSGACKLVLSLKRNGHPTRGNNNGRIITRQLRQLTPFGVKVGTFGFVKKHTVLLVYSALSNYSSSLLIALPHRYFSGIGSAA